MRWACYQSLCSSGGKTNDTRRNLPTQTKGLDDRTMIIECCGKTRRRDVCPTCHEKIDRTPLGQLKLYLKYRITDPLTREGLRYSYRKWFETISTQDIKRESMESLRGLQSHLLSVGDATGDSRFIQWHELIGDIAADILPEIWKFEEAINKIPAINDYL